MTTGKRVFLIGFGGPWGKYQKVELLRNIKADTLFGKWIVCLNTRRDLFQQNCIAWTWKQNTNLHKNMEICTS